MTDDEATAILLATRAALAQSGGSVAPWGGPAITFAEFLAKLDAAAGESSHPVFDWMRTHVLTTQMTLESWGIATLPVQSFLDLIDSVIP